MGRESERAGRTLKNTRSVCVGDGVHYIQEDHPHAIGRELADSIWTTQKNSLGSIVMRETSRYIEETL